MKSFKFELRLSAMLIAAAVGLLCAQTGALAESKGEAELKEGQALLEKKQYAKAVETFDKGISHDYKLKRILFYRAEAKENLKKYDGALDDYTEYAQAAPQDAEVLMRLSHLSEVQGKPNMALSYLSRVIVMHPKDGKLYAQRASLYDKLDQKENAGIDREVARKLGVTTVASMPPPQPAARSLHKAVPAKKRSTAGLKHTKTARTKTHNH